MPDDTIITEQTEEEIAAAEEAFGEDDTKGVGQNADDGIDDQDKTPESKDKDGADSDDKGDDPQGDDEKPPADEGEKKTGDEPKEPKPDDDKDKTPQTFEERLEARLKDIPDDPGEQAKKKEDKKPAEDPQNETPKVEPLTKEDISNRLGAISFDDLPGEVTIGNTTIDLKGYAEEYPDDANAILVLSSVIAEKLIDERLGKLEIPKPDAEANKSTQERLQKAEFNITQLAFTNALARMTNEEGELKHPDLNDILYGPQNEAFLAWGKEQKDPKIVKLLNSFNPKDGDLMLEYYKKDMAKNKTKEHDKKAGKDKKKRDAVYGSGATTTTPERQRPSGSSEDPEKEAEEAFNEPD